MVSSELGKEIEKDVFRLMGTKKKFCIGARNPKV